MFKRRRHLFVHKKKTHKTLFLICITVLCIPIAYIYIHNYLQHKLAIFLNDQQSFLQKQNFSLTFQSMANSSWEIWPQLVVTYPTLQKSNQNAPVQLLWQAKQASISYSLWHPLSILINIDGNQLLCPNQTSTSCLQIHGKSWNIYLPLLENRSNEVITLQCDETFYTNSTEITGAIQSLQLTKIQASLHWNELAKTNDSLAFSELNVQKALVNLATFPPQKLKNIQIQTALIKDNNNISDNFYRLLIQQAKFSWNNLSTNASGKLYIPFPKTTPTGELSLHIKGIDQTIYQQLIPLNCCQKLKEDLARTPLPSQLNFTVFIREGVFYVGAIPLETSWYNTIQTLIKTYTK